jgi:hypothetical protein
VLDGRILDPRRLPGLPIWRIVLGDRRVLLQADPIACAANAVPVALADDTVRHLGLNVPVLARLRHAAVEALTDAVIAAHEDDALAAWASMAPILGLDQEGHLAEFWTTLRLTIGTAADPWTCAHPDAW